MPLRNLPWFWMVVGLVFVLALLLFGRDLAHSRCAGPRWRRLLVGAGLTTLALLGWPVAAQDAPPPKTEVKADADLADAAEWKRITETWREAEEVASGRRGAYPFDKAGKEKLLAALDKAVVDVELLRRGGKVTPAEAGLLTEDLKALADGVLEKRSKEMQGATCYAPMPGPEFYGLRRLKARVPLLEALAAEKHLRPGVVQKSVQSVEQDLELVSNPEKLRNMTPAARKETEQVCKAVREQLKKLKARLGGP